MTNSIALGLGALILAFVGLDLWLDSGMIIFLGQKLMDLIRYLAFWR